MSQYPEPDASGASSLLPDQSACAQARPERVRHMVYGSLAAIDRTIKILHAIGYTDPNDWSDPTPMPSAREVRGEGETWMAIATKTVLIE
ncbi:MAG: hypothetical protein HC922_03720 [Leptolyngbyaceae cyanobacterium SM2_3_12]|nr:hypothetical protein [Leptolyngbyaceae cyanobacterium SM2_3_12]